MVSHQLQTFKLDPWATNSSLWLRAFLHYRIQSYSFEGSTIVYLGVWTYPQVFVLCHLGFWVRDSILWARVRITSPDEKFSLKFLGELHTTTEARLDVNYFVDEYLRSRSGGFFEGLTSVLTDEGRCLELK